MAIRLRGFQNDVKLACYNAWQDPKVRCVMPVLPTGAGKTVIMGDIAREYPGYGCAIAHRSELVGQIAIAFAREGVRHDIVAPKSVIRTIVAAQMERVGRSYYDPRAKWKVASVDTIIRRDLDQNWLRSVGLVFQDEGHHVLKDNKWGKAFSLFPNARGLFPTATPLRADGRGLGSHSDGMVDVMVEGPNMRWLIDNGYLTNYKVLAPHPSDLDLEGLDISAATGDYNVDQMRKRVKASTQIIGDVVATYRAHALGKRGICFAVDVEHATQIAAAFNVAGVAAAVVHAETPDVERFRYMREFEAGRVLMLVNVDLFGEGVDVPAIEVCIMARPTASYGLFTQQFGRALRLMISPILTNAWDTYSVAQRLQHIAESTKPVALVIDHVNNIIEHNGPPDWRVMPWSLDARAKRTRAVDGIPLRACVNILCLQPYLRIYPQCPYCSQEPPPPREPTRPEHVDGDLVLYTPEMLQALFGEKNKVDGPCYLPAHTAGYVDVAIRRRHEDRQTAQKELRAAMELTLPPTMNERLAQRKFFHTYGIDVLTAQTLGSNDALQLRDRIIQKVAK